MTDDDSFQIPVAFWQEMTEEESLKIFQRDGILTMAQTLRAWQLAGRPVRKPTVPIKLFFPMDQVMKEFPPPTHH